MDIALIGSRWLGAEVLSGLLQRGHRVTVVATDSDDRLARAAAAAGLPLTLLEGRRRVKPEDVPGEVDLIVAAHSHAFIPAEVRAKARLGAIGYHPSLLPRHRGIAAVEWTILAGDTVAGGSVYHLADAMDGGPIAAQEEVAVEPGEDAASLWRRALGPMGVRMLLEVIDEAERSGHIAAREQDPAGVTFAPAIKPQTAA